MPMRLLVLAATLGLLVAASAQAMLGRGTLQGNVTRGPIAPVCVAEQPCDEPAAHVTLVFARNGDAVGRVVTDADGSYRLRLPAGWYSVHRLGAGAIDRRLDPNRVRVHAGRVTNVDFSIDTGIR